METHESPDWSPSEAYWRALIEQGEVAGEPEPSAEDTHDRTYPAGDLASGDLDTAADHAAEDQAAYTNGATRWSKGRSDAMWATLREWQASGQMFDAPVIGCNKGGLLIRVCDGLGFVPASQLAELPRSLGTPDLRTDLESMVGRELHLRLIEVDAERDRVICSERATEWETAGADDLLFPLQARIGDEVEGIVRSVCDFGAFVDLGGVDGLIHISELSWQRVNHPSDVVSVDLTVRVRVLNVDMAARRVGLSLKRLHPDPWRLVSERHAVGDVIDAVITNVVHFGAFARIDEGIEGLIHISELSDRPFISPHEVVAEGQAIRARVLHVDPHARRLGLSIRQA